MEHMYSRLPILMRPRPKYPPEKNMLLTKKQLRAMNNKNVDAQINKLRRNYNNNVSHNALRSKTGSILLYWVIV